MFRRVFSSVLPATLVLVVLGAAAPAIAAGPDSNVAAWSTGSASWPGPGTLNQINRDDPDGAVNQSADDEDDSPDPVIRSGTVLVWPWMACATPVEQGPVRIGRSHSPCAAPARAPPTV
jgi:hypothetical protein